MGACTTLSQGAADVVLEWLWGAGEKGQAEHLEKEQTEAVLSEEGSQLYKSSLIYRKDQLLNK